MMSRLSRRLVATVSAVALVAVVGGASVAVDRAASSDDSSRALAAKKVPVVAPATKHQCHMGAFTETSSLTPPDDSVGDNVPAAVVTMKKTCAGPVVGAFTAEAFTAGAGTFIHVTMLATCVAKGGLKKACVGGQEFTAAPGHAFFQNEGGQGESNAATGLWRSLKRGVYEFEVLPGGDGTASLGFRTFVVEAYQKG